MREPFFMSSQQYMTHGGAPGLQRSLRPLEVRARRKRARWCVHGMVHGMLYTSPPIHYTRWHPHVDPHHTHMINCCNHQTQRWCIFELMKLSQPCS
jgi:hypothetical protein